MWIASYDIIQGLSNLPLNSGRHMIHCSAICNGKQERKLMWEEANIGMLAEDFLICCMPITDIMVRVLVPWLLPVEKLKFLALYTFFTHDIVYNHFAMIVGRSKYLAVLYL